MTGEDSADDHSGVHLPPRRFRSDDVGDALVDRLRDDYGGAKDYVEQLERHVAEAQRTTVRLQAEIEHLKQRR
jgi:hypothetical protein